MTGAASPSPQSAARDPRPASLLGRFVFYCALLLVAASAVPYGSIEPWWEAAFVSAALALGCLWAVEAVLTGGWGLGRRDLLLLLPAVALTLFALFQTLPLGAAAGAISADPFETRLFAAKVAALTLLGAILLRFGRARGRLHAMVIAVVGVGAASALFGILRQATQQEGEGFLLPHLVRGEGYAQFISRNQFCFMMEMALGPALCLAAARWGRPGWRLFYLAALLPIGAALILANSRGGVLTLLCQLLFFAAVAAPSLLAARGGRETGPRVGGGWRSALGSAAARVGLSAALAAAVVLAVVWVGGEPVVSNLSTVPEELGEMEQMIPRMNTSRADIWRSTWKLFAEHPVAGVGFGGYWTAITRHHDASGDFVPQQAHNDYLDLLAGGGIVGAGLVVWLVLSVLRRARAALAGGGTFRRAACLGALVGLFGVAVHSLVDFGLHITVNAALAVVLSVVAAVDVPEEGAAAPYA